MIAIDETVLKRRTHYLSSSTELSYTPFCEFIESYLTPMIKTEETVCFVDPILSIVEVHRTYVYCYPEASVNKYFDIYIYIYIYIYSAQ